MTFQHPFWLLGLLLLLPLALLEWRALGHAAPRPAAAARAAAPVAAEAARHRARAPALGRGAARARRRGTAVGPRSRAPPVPGLRRGVRRRRLGEHGDEGRAALAY